MEQALAAEHAFAAPSLQVPKPTLSAVCLFLSRVFTFLQSGFEFCEAAAKELKDSKLEYGCRFLKKQLESTTSRDRPYASLSPYRRQLSLFSEIQGKPDPIEAALSIDDQRRAIDFDTPPSTYSDAAPTSPGILRSERLEPHIGESEISTPILRPEVLADPERPTHRTYRVWYGTNRAPLFPSEPGRGFSANLDTKLHLGSCHVFVPKSHVVGSLGSSWSLIRLIWRTGERIQLQSIRPRTRDNFQAGISEELAARKGTRTAFVYVHGFQNTFEEAAMRAAQLACDLSVNGVTAFYSWASAGPRWAYLKDEETVRLKTELFIEFLDTLLEVHGIERLDIIAHSMGNRLLASVVDRLSRSIHSKRIGHIILAAPDISQTEFESVSHHYGAISSKRVTLYTCGRDWPLWLSTQLHGYVRVGYEPPICCCNGIDTISARHIDLDILGHGYYASAKPLIADLKQLLWQNLTPGTRGLTPLPHADIPEYWLLAKT